MDSSALNDCVCSQLQTGGSMFLYLCSLLKLPREDRGNEEYHRNSVVVCFSLCDLYEPFCVTSSAPLNSDAGISLEFRSWPTGPSGSRPRLNGKTIFVAVSAMHNPHRIWIITVKSNAAFGVSLCGRRGVIWVEWKEEEEEEREWNSSREWDESDGKGQVQTEHCQRSPKVKLWLISGLHSSPGFHYLWTSLIYRMTLQPCQNMDHFRINRALYDKDKKHHLHNRKPA